MFCSGKPLIATAATNGAVLVWNAERLGQSHKVTVGTLCLARLIRRNACLHCFCFVKLCGVFFVRCAENTTVMKEHERTTNRICWNSRDTNELLSASQDATIKLWVGAVSLSLNYVRGVRFHES